MHEDPKSKGESSGETCVYPVLSEPINVAFAIGAFAGLRTGEVLGLEWSDIDSANRRIHVQRQVKDGRIEVPKDNDSRVVPIQAPLLAVLAAWKLKSGGVGLVLKPKHPARGGNPGRPPTFLQPHTLWRHLAKALGECHLPEVTWYQATRHTFASQWVLAGGSVMRLSSILGHSSVEVTERYAHLLPDSFRETEFAMLKADLAHGALIDDTQTGKDENGAFWLRSSYAVGGGSVRGDVIP